MTTTKTFKIVWSTPDGKFGWTNIDECLELDEAISYWTLYIVGTKDVPYDAYLEKIEQI
jgi:hypothetical protein